MNIFNALNLRGNKLKNAVIDNWDYDTNGIEGALKYDTSSHTLQYRDNSKWVIVGSGSEVNNYNVDGQFAIFTSDTYPQTPSDSNRVVINAAYGSSPDNGDSKDRQRLRVHGDGLGNISLTRPQANTQDSLLPEQTVTTNITSVTAFTYDLAAQEEGGTRGDGGKTYCFQHNLDTEYVLVQTYLAELQSTSGSGMSAIHTYKPFSQILCDVDIVNEDAINITLFNIPMVSGSPAGLLRVIVYGTSANVVGANSSSSTNHVQGNTNEAALYVYSQNTLNNIDSVGVVTVDSTAATNDYNVGGSVSTSVKNNS